MENKVDVQKLVDMKSERVQFVKNNGTSDVWKFFKNVLVDGDQVNFVSCDRCDKLLKWKPRDGTNSLRIHIPVCKSKLPTPKITSVPGFSVQKPDVHVPATVKSDMADCLLNMCAKDIRYVLHKQCKFLSLDFYSRYHQRSTKILIKYCKCLRHNFFKLYIFVLMS